MINRNALKNFATQSRYKFIEQVKTKALVYGIDENNGLHIEEQFGQLIINGYTYPLSMKVAFIALQKQLEQKGYKQLLEEVAYTWFNRIIAIRYMEVNEYLPERVNVLSSSVGRVDPDILFEYDTMNLPIEIYEIKEILDKKEELGDGIPKTEKAFKKLFVAQCNALNPILPFLFEQIQDYTELLLPDFLLDAESVIKTLVQDEELTKSFEEIEVIGWLYQYYIAEEKDRVFAQKSKYKKEEIPFATQLFTPKWIVQYMVQNSLGRYWTEAHREDEDLIDNWEYFIKHEEEDFHEKIAPYVNKELKVEDIKLLDPAMGSGHILVYAFELFYEIYEKCGYPERDIPRLILENNLYGLDIDDRAYQLAAFAVVMKAASYSKRFLRSVEREGIKLNLASIQETNHISDDMIAYIAQQELGERYNQVKAFFDQYHNAKTYGSLINITEREISFIEERLKHIQNHPVYDLFYAEPHEIAKQVLPALIQQTKIMRGEYDTIVMNPPYMGLGNMGKELGDFLKKYYPNSKSDLFAAFMEVNHYLRTNSFYAAINQHSWMFLSSYEVFRKYLIANQFIDNMLHLGPRTFEEISGEVVQSTSFVLRNYKIKDIKGCYLRLIEGKNSGEKISLLKTILDKNEHIKSNLYTFEQEKFLQISGAIIGYWLNQNILKSFKNNSLAEYSISDGQNVTGDNAKYVRFFWEVDKNKINEKWFLYAKGGGYRKWYGNLDSIIDWSENARKFYRENSSSRIIPEYLWFKEGITWSLINSNSPSFRILPKGATFDKGGSSIFIKSEYELNYFLGLLNSQVFSYYLNILNPTLNIQVRDVRSLPIIVPTVNKKIEIEKYVKENITISKKEWDSNEYSLDFIKHPLLRFKSHSNDLKEVYNQYVSEVINDINNIHINEKKLNEIFTSLYKLEDELAEVEDAKGYTHVSIKDTAITFLSYFIGCIMGRYNIGKDGIVYAGGEWDASKYSSLQPTKNGVVHFTDSSYFENDVIARLREFLAVAFVADTVEENLQWLAEALVLKNGEDAETRLRRYFMDEFFADHCKMYQKRPIYWLVDSGKQKGLRTLLYMHRYQPDTMATIRFEQLQEIQAKYQQEITDLENRLVNPNLSATDKKKLNAEKVSFGKKIDELREFDKRLAEYATAALPIELDDGVKENYEKFYRGGKGVLAKIK